MIFFYAAHIENEEFKSFAGRALQALRSRLQKWDSVDTVTHRGPSDKHCALTTIVQLTELEIFRVRDVLVRGEEEHDVALLILDRHDVE